MESEFKIQQPDDKKVNKVESLSGFSEIIQVFPISAQCELLQLINGLRLVAEIVVLQEYEKRMIPSIEMLKKQGFFTTSYNRQGKAGKITHFYISRDITLVNEAVDPRIDAKRFGQLMGYPNTAIDEYVSNKNYLSDEELVDLIGFENHFFYLKFSKSHPEEAIEYLRKSYKILLEQAPHILEKGLPLDIDIKKYKGKVEEFVYGRQKIQKSEI